MAVRSNSMVSSKQIAVLFFCIVVCLQLFCILGSPISSTQHHSTLPHQQEGVRLTTSGGVKLPVGEEHGETNSKTRARLKDALQQLQQMQEKHEKLEREKTHHYVARVKPVPPVADADEDNREISPVPPRHKEEWRVVSGGGAVAQASTPPDNRHVVLIHVFTYNRLVGLKRLLASLVRADYSGICHPIAVVEDEDREDDHNNSKKDEIQEPSCSSTHAIHLKIFMDFPKKGSVDYHKAADTREFLNTEFVWPHGTLSLHRREVNVGLKKSILEAWYPLSDTEVGAFFEDDVEVSVEWFQWAVRALGKYAPIIKEGKGQEKKIKYKIDGNPKLLGVSLFRPIHDELSGKSCKVDNDHNPFLLQQPCSWGAIYLPKPWRAFRDWYDEEGVNAGGSLKDPNDPNIRPSSNTWDSRSSWKKYLIKYMYTMGWVMVYPNPAGNKVLSTNHLMEGEHPTPPKHLFELPLVGGDDPREGSDSFLFKFPNLHALQAYDVMFRRTKGKGTLKTLPNYEQSPAAE